jgi:hypothetical protein
MHLNGPVSSPQNTVPKPPSFGELWRDFWSFAVRMPEHAPTAPNVVRARRWALAILVPYAIIPPLLFAIIPIIRPYRRDDAVLAIGYVYLANVWLLGLARLAYRQIIKRPQSLNVKMGIVGALVILGLVILLYLAATAYYVYYKCCDDGQVGAFLGFILMGFSPELGAIGWGMGDFIAGFIGYVRGATRHRDRIPRVDHRPDRHRSLRVATALLARNARSAIR